MTKPINVSTLINVRLDAAGFVSINLTKRLKDYFSDIDEELAQLRDKARARGLRFKQLQATDTTIGALCWFCKGNSMVPMDDAPKDWFECSHCGATACKNPSGKARHT